MDEVQLTGLQCRVTNDERKGKMTLGLGREELKQVKGIWKTA